MKKLIEKSIELIEKRKERKKMVIAQFSMDSRCGRSNRSIRGVERTIKLLRELA